LSAVLLILRPDDFTGRGRTAATRALWTLVGLTFLISTTAGVVERLNRGFHQTTVAGHFLVAGVSMTFAAIAAFVGLSLLVSAIMRYFNETRAGAVERDLVWSTLAWLVAAAQIALWLALTKLL
jgi:hypothetical protein